MGSKVAGRGRLAVVFDQGASSPLQLKDTLGAHFDLIWVINRNLPGPESLLRLLKRLGPVVDITNSDLATAVEELRVEGPDGLMCFSDQCIQITADLARSLDLPALPTECTGRLIDKHAQRRAFEAAGLAVPKFWRVPMSNDPGRLDPCVDAIETEATFPVVVKPEIGEGSRNTEPAADPATMRRLLLEASGRRRDTVIEEMLVGDPDLPDDFGDYVSVESLVSDGHISHLMITGRLPLATPFRETGFFMPAAIDDATRDQVLQVASDAIAAVNFTVGSTHTEIKLTAEGPRVIEINGRLGGGMADLLALVSDLNLFELAGRVATGERIDIDGPIDAHGLSYLFYVQAPASAERVVGIDGIEEFSHRDGVVEVQVHKPAGSAVDWREGNHGNVFSVLGTVPDPDDFYEVIHAVEQKVTISYD